MTKVSADVNDEAGLNENDHDADLYSSCPELDFTEDPNVQDL
jgi:hypothetical protein